MDKTASSIIAPEHLVSVSPTNRLNYPAIVYISLLLASLLTWLVSVLTFSLIARSTDKHDAPYPPVIYVFQLLVILVLPSVVSLGAVLVSTCTALRGSLPCDALQTRHRRMLVPCGVTGVVLLILPAFYYARHHALWFALQGVIGAGLAFLFGGSLCTESTTNASCWSRLAVTLTHPIRVVNEDGV